MTWRIGGQVDGRRGGRGTRRRRGRGGHNHRWPNVETGWRERAQTCYFKREYRVKQQVLWDWWDFFTGDSPSLLIESQINLIYSFFRKLPNTQNAASYKGQRESSTQRSLSMLVDSFNSSFCLDGCWDYPRPPTEQGIPVSHWAQSLLVLSRYQLKTSQSLTNRLWGLFMARTSDWRSHMLVCVKSLRVKEHYNIFNNDAIMKLQFWYTYQNDTVQFEEGHIFPCRTISKPSHQSVFHVSWMEAATGVLTK